MPFVAPWTNVNPSDFTSAAERGASLGLQYRGQNIDAGEREQALAQSAAEQQQAHALEQERIQGALAEAKQRTDLATQAAARRYQAQASYQHAIDTGIDPVQAMLTFGPQMGQSLTGLGALSSDQFKQRQAALPPLMVPGPDGTKPAGYTYGGRFYPTPQKAAPKVVGIGAKARLAAAQKAVENAVTPEDIKAAQENLDKIAEEIDNPETEQEEQPSAPEARVPEGFIGTPGVTRNLSDLPMIGSAPTATATAEPSASTNQNDPLGLFTK